MSKKPIFLCNCRADEVEEKFGPDVINSYITGHEEEEDEEI